MIHQINIFIHIAAGTFALIIGTILLVRKKGTIFHKKAGKVFVLLLTIVTCTGFIGWLFFRSNPFLLMLTILAGYNTFSGYRVVKLKGAINALDLILAVATLSTGGFYLFYLMHSDANWSPSVIYPTVAGIVLVTSYDIIKIVFLSKKLKSWWLYEHIYKIVSAFSAILSAFVGTVLPGFKPYSQIGPSTVCLLLILIFIWHRANSVNKRAKPVIHL